MIFKQKLRGNFGIISEKLCKTGKRNLKKLISEIPSHLKKNLEDIIS